MVGFFGSIETVIKYWGIYNPHDKTQSIRDFFIVGFIASTIACLILGFVGTKIMNKVLDEGDNFK